MPVHTDNTVHAIWYTSLGMSLGMEGEGGNPFIEWEGEISFSWHKFEKI